MPSSPPERIAQLDSAAITVSLRAYALDVIKKAAYRLLDRGVVEITPDGDNAQCTIRFRTPLTPEEARGVCDDLWAEILDQDLRAIVAQETAPVRNAILAHVFSRTRLHQDG
jgi:His-Xaa-Ser system protein HxsD